MIKYVSMIVWNEFLNDARVLKEAQTLQGAGNQVTVLALHTPGVTEEHEELDDGIKVRRIARSPLWKIRKRNIVKNNSSKGTVSFSAIAKPTSMTMHRQILRLIARIWTHIALCFSLVRSKPDVIHAHDVNVLPTAWLASKLARSKLVYDAHEISSSREGYQAFRNAVAWIEKKLMPKAEATITTTDMRAKFFARAYHLPRPVVLQNRPRFQALIRSNRIREELGLTERWPIIIYQGGLQQGRGLPKMVQAAKHVGNAYFVFIGGGRMATELHEFSESLGLNERVKFIPTVALADLHEYTCSADIGVQPIENTCLNHLTTDSNKLFEYLMAGLPVVATNFPEIRKVVNGNQVGLLIEDQCLHSLVDALNKLVKDENLRLKFRENAIRSARRLSWEAQEENLLNLYKNIKI